MVDELDDLASAREALSCGFGEQPVDERLIVTELRWQNRNRRVEVLGEDLKDLRSGDLRRAIRRGDKFVAKVVEEAANYIGLAVGNLINIFNPEVVMLGGGNGSSRTSGGGTFARAAAISAIASRSSDERPSTSDDSTFITPRTLP